MLWVAAAGPLSNFAMALFWALVACSPMVLLTGLVAGLIGQGLPLNLLSAMTAAIFLTFWVINLKEAGQGDAA